MNEHFVGTKRAERLLTQSGGATMREIIEATGGPQYNVLKRLEARGYRVRRVKEGKETRYFAQPPAVQSYDATVTSK
jgi:sugar-specific transcriptional regulator TrmB